jgi:monoamine oxidase
MVPRSPFWQKDGLSPNMFTDAKAGMVVAERKASSPSEVTSLTAWLRGPLADELDKMTETDAIGSVIESIETLRPSAKNQLEPVAYHSWFQNPYSEGDWAIWGPGQIRKFGADVATPHGQIHFCGEHTAVSNRGMEGAMESGERVALEVLGVV